MTAWALALVPGLAGLGLTVVGRRPKVLGAVAAAVLAATVAVAGWAAAAGSRATFAWGPELALTLEVRGLARVMVVLVPAVALPVAVYAAAHLAADPGLARLVGLLVAFVGAMELLVAAADFLTLLLAWELVGACSWALIGHGWRDGDHPRAATHAFVVTRLGDLGLYLAAGAALAATGSFAFADLSGADGPEAHMLAGGLLLAAAAKSAQLPFSPWLFSAMAGPTPVSALLHSATMVAAGAYALARLVPDLAAVAWLAPAVALLGVATALAGGVVAAVQPDLKRALAASTSAQYGLVLVAVGAGSVTAAGAHLVTHAAFKSLLFLGAGVAIRAVGTGDLGRRPRGPTPRAAAALFGVGALALAAVPPLGGAASKEAVLAAAAHEALWLGGAVLAAGLLSAFYAARLQLLTWRRSQPGPSPPVELGAMAVLAAATVALGGLWLPGLLPGGTAWELGASLATVAAGVAGAWLLGRRDALPTLRLPPRLHAGLADWFRLPALARHLVAEPVLAVAALLAAVDDRVIDAGGRAAAAVAAASSRALSWWAERGVDGLVWAVAGGVLGAARRSRITDDRGIDAAVEGTAAGIGGAGRHSRRLQTGLAHHYYVLVAVGVVVAVAVAALGSG